MKSITYVSGKNYEDKVKDCIVLDSLVYENKYIGNQDFYIKSFETRCENFIFAIDTENGNLAGYILYTPLNKKTYNDMKTGNYIDTEFIHNKDVVNLSEEKDNYLYIYSLVVSPYYQGMGVGKGLLTRLFDDIDRLSKEYNIKTVLADTINPIVVRYMSRNNFIQKRVTNHQSVIMEKTYSEEDTIEMVI